MTAYRQQALPCAASLAGGARRTSEIRTAIPNAPSILLRNVYGWFNRVQRGVYELTPEGTSALARWPQPAHGRGSAARVLHVTGLAILSGRHPPKRRRTREARIVSRCASHSPAAKPGNWARDSRTTKLGKRDSRRGQRVKSRTNSSLHKMPQKRGSAKSRTLRTNSDTCGYENIFNIRMLVPGGGSVPFEPLSTWLADKFPTHHATST